MVILDLLAAAVECWVAFLAQMLPNIQRFVAGFDDRSRLQNASALERLTSLIRNLDLAIRYTLRAASSSIAVEESITRRSLDTIESELTFKVQSLGNRIQDMISEIEKNSGVRRSIAQENQTLAVNRLTVLAAIFLPISLASSLLSMSTRVVDLGVLWYDYFGIASTLIFFVYIIYGIMRGKDDLQQVAATKLAELLDRMGRSSNFGRWLANVASNLMSLIAEEAIFPSLRRGPFWANVPLLVGLSAMITASFWVGMIIDYQYGLKVLWIGVVSMIAFSILVWVGILVYRVWGGVARQRPPGSIL